jgi:hypothetical protein
MKKYNPYIEQIRSCIPRLLALYDTDSFSPTYGVGDRYRWAWKLIDFGNGTFQGAAHGLSRLLMHNMLPEEVSEKAVMRRIDAMFHGAEALRYSNGSMAEAFPYESSFCVTSLVAYDLLSAVEHLSTRLDDTQRTSFLNIVRPMIHFLHHSDETHGFISNHLATAAAALYKWSVLTGEPGEERGYLFLKRILAEQSDEGWFKEYEGADPGYQSLCTYYMADIHRMRPELSLIDPLRKSVQFLWHFAHPDGSFGGYYGSRNTRFYYPAGIEALTAEIEEAAVLGDFMRHSISRHTTVTLDTVDEPNLVPMFNAYCWSAVLLESNDNRLHQNLPALPAVSDSIWRSRFSEAGLLIDKGEKHYTIISLHKGGVCYHFLKERSLINAGVVAQSSSGQYYSTQAYQPGNNIQLDGDSLTVTAPLIAMNKQLPAPSQFIILRLMNITIMRSLSLGNWVKKLIVRLLITGKKAASVSNRRTIHLGPDVVIEDNWQGEAHGFRRMDHEQPFSAIHMASQGYWQKQDDTE